jgi:cytochrome c oxidase assembly factor CtaG
MRLRSCATVRRGLQAGVAARATPPAIAASTSLALALMTACGTARAHGVEAGADPFALAAVEPWVAGCLVVSAALYAIGLHRVWQRAAGGRRALARRALAFAAGWFVLAVALLPPLDGLGTELFWAHMVQHELLMIGAAPLLVLGRPLGIWAWGLPRRWRRAVGQAFHAPLWRAPWQRVTAPLGAWLLHALALWTWHAPALFDAALARPGVHVAQHIAFLASALLYWWSLLGSATRARQGIALLSLFTTMVHTGALGALLTLASTPWYPTYLATTAAHGLEPLQDQQLGGLVMWVPASLGYLGVALWLASRWIGPARPRRVHRLPTAPC